MLLTRWQRELKEGDSPEHLKMERHNSLHLSFFFDKKKEGGLSGVPSNRQNVVMLTAMELVWRKEKKIKFEFPLSGDEVY